MNGSCLEPGCLSDVIAEEDLLSLTELKNVYTDSLLLEGQVLKLLGGGSLKIVFTLNTDSQSKPYFSGFEIKW